MPAEPFRTQRRVEFSDTDMAGIVHFSVFFRYMEAAEHAFLRSLGFSIFDPIAPDEPDTRISFPRVSAKCDYKSPARCEDELDIEVAVNKIGQSSIAYGFRVLRDEELLAVGEMTSVCCRLRHRQKPEPIPLPAEILTKLAQHIA